MAACVTLGNMRQPKVPELAGIAEVARLAGVSRQAVTNWRARYADFPKPVAQLEATPVFVVAVVRAWVEKRAEAERKRAQAREDELAEARKRREEAAEQRLVDAWDASQRKRKARR